MQEANSKGSIVRRYFPPEILSAMRFSPFVLTLVMFSVKVGGNSLSHLK